MLPMEHQVMALANYGVYPTLISVVPSADLLASLGDA